MDLISNFKPSMDRIFGNNLPQARSSFQTILVVLQRLEELIMQPQEKDEVKGVLSMLQGAIKRHFELEAQLMPQHQYDEYSTEVHIEKHCAFLETVTMFCFNFHRNTPEQNVIAYRSIQKWLLHHLLMDDAHFMQRTFRKK